MEEKILVIDDSEINRILLGDILDLDGFEYDLCQCVLKSLELYKKGNYNLVLMDIEMPNINGVEGIKLFREEDPNCKLIAVTANAFSKDIEEYKRVGFNDVIVKPFKIKELLKTINEVIKC